MNNSFHRVLHGAAGVSGLLTLLFALLPRSGLCLSLAITCGTTFYHFAMRLLVGLAGRYLFPAGGEKARWFREKPWEKALYRKLHVKKWKDRMPTYLPDAFDLRRHSLPEIIRTTCISELTHEIIIPLSFLPLLMIPAFGAAPVFIISSCLAAMLDGVFVIMQRYNRPRLVRVARKGGAAV